VQSIHLRGRQDRASAATSERAPATGWTRAPTAGALLGAEDVTLRLTGLGREWDLDAAAKDPDLQAALEATFKRRDP
jgi:hypothetical protein